MTTSAVSTSKTSSSRAKSSNASETAPRAKRSTSSVAPRLKAPPAKSSPKSARAGSSSSSPSTSAESSCAHCGGSKPQLKYVTRSFGKGAHLLVIESIPMWSCPSCGESYFTAKTMHELERIKALRKSVAKPRSVPVAQFEEAGA